MTIEVNIKTGYFENYKDLIPLQGDLKQYDSLKGRDALKDSILSEGIIFPTFIWENLGIKYIWDGHGRQDVYNELATQGYDIPDLPVVYIIAKNRADAKIKLLKKEQDYRRRINKSGLADFVSDELIKVSDLEGLNLPGLGELDISFLDGIIISDDLKVISAPSNGDNNSKTYSYDGEPSTPMTESFGIPPFSIFDTKQGYWQSRKKWWLSKGLQSDKGRDAGAFTTNGSLTKRTDVSIFDPVLSEICYTWFSPLNGQILDPFAGGSVRGLVASLTNRKYVGVDLRKEQVEENIMQAEKICKASNHRPKWITGDSLNIVDICSDVKADMIFSCPPYADLEVYSDDPADISNMEYDDFLKAYNKIIANSCKLLKDDAFACFVVGEVRDKKGNYYNFVSDTISAFIGAGLNYYNEIILANSIGTLPLRAGKTFRSGRKIGKMHQNILVFVKGDSKQATINCGDINLTSVID